MNIQLPLDKNKIKQLKAGDKVFLSGNIISGRDAAHKKMYDALTSGAILPFNIKNQTIFYVGPCPAKGDMASGSAGPTTSLRMTKYAPTLLDNGLLGIIGKGELDKSVTKSIIKNGGIYFAAIGGAGAVYAKCIKESKVVAFPELLTEAVHLFSIENFPCIVAIDCYGNSIYKR